MSRSPATTPAARGPWRLRSPYDGESRATLRIGLAVVCAIDVLWLAGDVHGQRAGPDAHPLAPRLLLDLGGSSLPLLVLVVAGLGALLLFARPRAPPWTGAVALAVLAVLCEANAALSRGPQRRFFTPGAALFGWLCGAAFARAIGRHAPAGEAPEEEALPEFGAVAAFAATYVGAALSKLTSAGLLWADEMNLRAVIAAQHTFDDRSWLGEYARLVLDHPGLSRALALAALGIQAGAVLYALGGPRLRVVWTALIASFHLNVFLLAGIAYADAFALLLLFGLPWPVLVRRATAWVRRRPSPSGRRERAPPAPLPSVPPRVALGAAALVVVAVALAWLLPIRQYTALHHRHAIDSPR